ncbi:sugar ABC transporter ATP-binding protein [Ktedonospora formicarum]|nr:sugar ABC transporter ATP-binding protein [Ktedonospora formicarum]
MGKLSLSAQGLVKRYGGVTALANGSLTVRSGEVLALMGANGSGKSTLSKIITGAVAPDKGQLVLNGQAVRFTSPLAARRHGIVEVFQELSLIPDMTVAENIWLAHEPLLALSMIRRREVQSRTRDLLNLFAGTVSDLLQPETLVAALSSDERQIVEILKALSHQPELLILDEATASLDKRQVERLFELIGQWKAQGMALIFVSHRMQEIFRVCERATVLRNGLTVDSRELATTSESELVSLMVEQGAVERYTKQTQETLSSGVRVEVQDLRTKVLRGVSLQVHEGEIVGLGGLRGQGQSDVLQALFGAIPKTGTITLEGKPVRFTHPSQAMRAGLAYVPGDRGQEGLLPVRSILENLQLPSWAHYGLPLNMRGASQEASEITQRLGIVMASLQDPVRSLSGGNAQKVVLGKWLLREPRILLLDDPTKGVDVKAKSEIYQLLAELRAQGASIVIYSSEDEELLGLSDRVFVLHDGLIRAELSGETLTRTELVAASLGSAGKDSRV